MTRGFVAGLLAANASDALLDGYYFAATFWFVIAAALLLHGRLKEGGQS